MCCDVDPPHGRPTAQMPGTVTARKVDAPAAVQAAIANVAGVDSISVDGGLIQTDVTPFIGPGAMRVGGYAAAV
jgi:hypothetical protein